MTYSDLVEVFEILITVFGAVGIALGLYLLRAERHDRALLITDNGATGILSWSLVLNESLRIVTMVLLLIVGIVSLWTANQTAPASVVGPLMPVMAVLFGALSVAQSAVLIYARARIARYVPTDSAVARQETLLDVQRDVNAVGDQVGGVQDKIAKMVRRADESERRADVSEKRADDAEKRESDG